MRQTERRCLDELVNIVCRSLYCTSRYLATLPNYWNSTVMAPLNAFPHKKTYYEHGYTATCPSTKILKSYKLLNTFWIISTAHLLIKEETPN